MSCVTRGGPDELRWELTIGIMNTVALLEGNLLIEHAQAGLSLAKSEKETLGASSCPINRSTKVAIYIRA